MPPLEPRRVRPALKAEREGFEPTVQFPGHGISSAAQSTTLSPLRGLVQAAEPHYRPLYLINSEGQSDQAPTSISQAMDFRQKLWLAVRCNDERSLSGRTNSWRQCAQASAEPSEELDVWSRLVPRQTLKGGFAIAERRAYPKAPVRNSGPYGCRRSPMVSGLTAHQAQMS